MKKFSDMTKGELEQALSGLNSEFEVFKQKGMKLDMSRGKPGASQLDMVMDVLDIVNSSSDLKNEDSVDCRNYMLVDGLPEMRRLFAEVLDVTPDQVIAAGNSSLTLMFDCVAQGMYSGFGAGPWLKQEKIKFLCPSPGYDRHFSVCEYFGIEMISVDMTDSGPDMDAVEKLIKDPNVKGIWCVPKYSNPTGITFSDETVRRMAALRPAAVDFRIMWDNSYAVHDLYDTTDRLLPIMAECEKNNNADIVFIFTSTSKITFPGAGVAAVAASENNIKALKARLSMQTIGPDKINQLRHVRKFSSLADIKEHMQKFIPVLKPKFDTVIEYLSKELTATPTTWNSPRGGYFISVDVLAGTAKRVIALCKEGGVVLTSAGATYPYGKDPKDSNIRIAPTLPPVAELKAAMELFCIAVKKAAAEKYLKM